MLNNRPQNQPIWGIEAPGTRLRRCPPATRGSRSIRQPCSRTDSFVWRRIYLQSKVADSHRRHPTSPVFYVAAGLESSTNSLWILTISSQFCVEKEKKKITYITCRHSTRLVMITKMLQAWDLGTRLLQALWGSCGPFPSVVACSALGLCPQT